MKNIEKNTNSSLKIEIFDENIIIYEGVKKNTEQLVYNRSKKLRDYALNYYSTKTGLNCQCCNFNFADFYGKDIGENFIEMHHIKPVFKYENDDLEKIISNAVKNIVPLCSNCHRMVHRVRAKPLELQSIIDSISDNGVFKLSSINI